MNKFAIVVSAGLLTLGAIGAAEAQQPNAIQGTPGSIFPNAAPNEVHIINGVPCRTVLVQGTNTRVPVECAGAVASGVFDPSTTGSIRIDEMSGPALSASPFPYATPNEVQIINGVPCRTVLVQGTNTRVPVECAR
ncbi:hypothetical protein [Microvirga brassicacearum]|uniref:Uncharacterized protein n=1 Tax=Microvirga brassicacearum TaxID=2580413 RepID=A0A5N3P374_9HYPH|nr:hypothetical protein [Microvirga brassicacearum]KAB0264172.1 hypothetical protein FEZ63_24330 [Microvirga brassicacearum]